MSPTHVRRNGEEPVRGSEATIEPTGLTVTRIRVRHGEVMLFDEQGRESVLITRGIYPGAGMCVELADHVETREGT